MSQLQAGNRESARWVERRHHPASVGVMALITLALVAATVWRIDHSYAAPSLEFDWQKRGFSDFHNGTYFPSRAFAHGDSPYAQDTAEDYLMARATPPYSPFFFVLHTPIGILPLNVAQILFFAITLMFLVALAACSLKMSGQSLRSFDLLGITSLLLVSRPGHITLFTGYFTAEIVLGAVVALHFARTRPVLSGLGLVFASFKPNFIIPLVIMMLFRKNFRAVGIGILFCVVGAGSGLGWLASHNGIEQTVQELVSGHEAVDLDPAELPVNTWTRVDVLSLIAKLVVGEPGDLIALATMMFLLLVPGWGVYRICDRETNAGATGISALIVCLAVLLGLYHHSYDCLLIAVPAISLVFFGQQTMPEIPTSARRFLAAMLCVPAINYVSTKSIMEALELVPRGILWQGITLINTASLLLAITVALAVAFRSTMPRAVPPPS